MNTLILTDEQLDVILHALNGVQVSFVEFAKDAQEANLPRLVAEFTARVENAAAVEDYLLDVTEDETGPEVLSN